MSKHTSTTGYINIDGEIWEVNSGWNKNGYPLPVFTKQMRSIIQQLNVMTANYSRVLVVRFDLHLYEFSDDNKMLSQFIKLLTTRIKKEYSFKDIGSVWCRELERAKQQHYHVALFLEGRKIRTPHNLRQKIKDTWLDVGGRSYHMAKYHMVNRNDWKSKADAIKHLSYLAKERGKGYRPQQTKDYGSSRLKMRL